MLPPNVDVLWARLGPARSSHPDEYAAIMHALTAAGVEIHIRSGVLAYSPAPGRPGRFLFDPDASIAALGYYLSRIDEFWRLEFRGYQEEIRMARQLRDFNAGRRILGQMRARRQELFGE